MSDEELHDALEPARATRCARGFDEVFAAASDDAATAGSAPAMVEHGTATGDLDSIPFVTSETPARRRGRPIGSMIAAAGVAALVVVGTFAVGAVVGNSGSGSGSPEGAVRRLADALSHEDPLAAADVLAPSEVRSLHGTLQSAERKAAELKLVQTAGAPLTGIDFQVTGLQLSTQSLGSGYAKVTVDEGTFSASTHKPQFSPLMQKVLRNTRDNSAHADLAKLAENMDLPTFVVAVRDGGRWYVSAAYTVLEYIREANQLPAADFGSGDACNLDAGRGDARCRRAGIDASAATVRLDEAHLDGSSARVAGVRLPGGVARAGRPQYERGEPFPAAVRHRVDEDHIAGGRRLCEGHVAGLGHYVVGQVERRRRMLLGRLRPRRIRLVPL